MLAAAAAAAALAAVSRGGATASMAELPPASRVMPGRAAGAQASASSESGGGAPSSSDLEHGFAKPSPQHQQQTLRLQPVEEGAAGSPAEGRARPSPTAARPGGPTAIPEISGEFFSAAEAEQWKRRLAAAQAAQESGNTIAYRAALGSGVSAGEGRPLPDLGLPPHT